MKKDTSPKLCGGTFFVLFREACISSNDKDVLLPLIKIFIPCFEVNNQNTFSTNTSNFRRCYNTCDTYFHFKDDWQVRSFQRSFENEYASLLSQMNQIIDAFIKDRERLKWLVSALIELIEMDDSISGNAVFLIGAGGSSVTKNELLDISEIRAPEFLLGVWHYVLVNKIDNRVGKKTYDDWYTGDLETAQSFSSYIGLERSSNIVLHSVSGKAESANEILSVETSSENNSDSGSILPEAVLSYKDPYYVTAYKEHCLLKTLLYKYKRHSFYSFFECNDVYVGDPYYDTPEDNPDYPVIKNCTVSQLSKISNHIMLTGTGGIGKSMMLRHLLMDSIANSPDMDLLPILFEVRAYEPADDKEENKFVRYIFHRYKMLSGTMTFDAFLKKVEGGKLILLFDGLDEISKYHFKYFCIDLNEFISMYPDNICILSSRPFSTFMYLRFVTVLQMRPLTKAQALSLVDKLEFDSIIKANFKEDLNNVLYDSHTEFCQNPLLLTLMLLMYERFADIPSRIHEFYKTAYLTLALQHDKDKNLTREFATEMDAVKFEEAFAEFCARSYYDECFSFSEERFRSYYNQLRGIAEVKMRHDYKDFLEDAKDKLCLINYDGYYYSFIHRSFQEYFCALYCSRLDDNRLPEIGSFFDSRMDYSMSDNTFSMLRDMAPKRVDQFIFFDFLKKRFEATDEKGKRIEYDYWLFLKDQYDTIDYWEGDIGEQENDPLEANSFIYREFCIAHGISHEPIRKEIPANEHFAHEYYYYVDEHWDDIDWIDQQRFKLDSTEFELRPPNNPVVVRRFEIPLGYYELFEEHPAGISYRINIGNMLIDIDSGAVDYTEIINALEDDDFPLMKEYTAVKNCYYRLKEKYDNPVSINQRALIFGD